MQLSGRLGRRTKDIRSLIANGVPGRIGYPSCFRIGPGTAENRRAPAPDIPANE
jgi:hypothetical protein